MELTTLLLGVVAGTLVPTAVQLWWEFYQARETRRYVDRRVNTSEAKAQKDRDGILAEATATRGSVEALIAALQEPAAAQAPASPGFAHGMIDPVDAVAAREAKKAERMERRMMNAASIAEALGERAPFAKQILSALGFRWDDVLDHENIEFMVSVLRKVAGNKQQHVNGNGGAVPVPHQ